MLSGSVFSKQYWTEAVATACYTQNKSTVVKRHLKTPYEFFCKRIPNISFLHVFGCPVYIQNHKDHLGKFDENADDGYLLRYSLVSKAFRVFNTRRQQTKETYHTKFDESPKAIKFSKPSVDNINIAESKRYPPDEYIHPYKPSQTPQDRWSQDKYIELVNIISNPGPGMLRRAMARQLNAALAHECLFIDFLSKKEPKKTLIPAPYGETIIGSRWVFKNKRDETGIVIKNKARLVAQGYNHSSSVELMDIVPPTPYDSPLTGIYTPRSDEGRLKLEELMDLCTTLSNRVSTLEDELSSTKAVYHKAFITLIKRVKKLEAQLKQKRSRTVIHSSDEEDQLSLDEELAQNLYAEELANKTARQEQEKYNLEKALELQRQLDKRENVVEKGDQVEEIDWNDPIVLRYHALHNRPFSKAEVRKNMVMYLKNQGGYKQSYFKGMKYEDIRPIFKRANPKGSHLIFVKIFFRYLKDTSSLGLRYLKCLGFDLKEYSDSDYAGCNIDRKSTSGACQLLGGKLVCWSAKKQQSIAMSLTKAEYVVAAGCCANILWMKSQLIDYDIIYEKVFNVHNWILKLNQFEEPPFTNHMKAICNLDVPVDSKAPKYSSSTEEVPQGKKPGARSGLRRKQSSKHTFESTTKASKS
nr:retrovirus-related Pol polyprotein from transposon TNT 1-94 [Tanacetum cinerariifolium]